MTEEELHLIQQILPALFKHFTKYPRSLLARIYGVYTIQMQGYEKVHLMLMSNTLDYENRESVIRVYDLKGSTCDRFVKTETATASSTLKDTNFLLNQRESPEILLSRKILLQIN